VIHVQLKLTEVVQAKLSQVDAWREEMGRVFPLYHLTTNNILQVLFPCALTSNTQEASPGNSVQLRQT